MRAPHESKARKTEATIGSVHSAEVRGCAENRATENRNFPRRPFEPRTANGLLSPARSLGGQGEELESRCTKIGRGASGDSFSRLNNRDSVARSAIMLAMLQSRGNSLDESALREEIRHRRLEPNHRLARLGISKLFAGEALDGLLIVFEGVDRSLQLPAGFFGFGNLSIQAQNFFAHALVLLDQGKIPNRDPKNAGQDQEEDHEFCELAPDPEIDVHLS